MNRQRRQLLQGILVAGAGVALVPMDALAGPRRRRVRRRVRRRMRRIRRRVIWRTVTGRRLLVVPVACAVGWELMIDNRVAVVQTVQPGQVVVQYPDNGSVATVPVALENTPENSQDMPGSEYEQEVEEEVDE